MNCFLRSNELGIFSILRYLATVRRAIVVPILLNSSTIASSLSGDDGRSFLIKSAIL